MLKTGTIPAVQLPPQIVRIDSDSAASVAGGNAGVAPQRVVKLLGIRNHATLPDTDIEEGYTFQFQSDSYRVIDILIPPATPGECQARCVANG